MTRYSTHFTEAELRDPTTGEIKLEDGFIDQLEELRLAYGYPMAVTSGCRSSEHNEWLTQRGYAASPHSLHLMNNPHYGTNTLAVDITRPGIYQLRTLIGEALARGWTVRLADSFVHLDLRGRYTDLKPHFDTY